MKISSVGFLNLNRTQNKNLQVGDKQKGVVNVESSPIYAGKITYPMTFLGCTDFQKIKALTFKNMKGLPDPISGIIMVPQSDFLRILTEEALSKTSRHAVKVISQFEESMFPIEKQAFQIVTKLSKKAPLRNLHELLEFVQPEYLSRLKRKQSNIISQIEEITKTMSEDSKEDILFVTEMSKDLIAEKHDGGFFKRKSLIKQLNNLQDKIPEKEEFKKILDLVSTLPDSSNDIDAFMVKYAKPDRDSFELGKRFVSPSVGTIEHIIPSAAGGEDLASNKVVEAYKFNHEKSFYLLPQQIEKHPEMIKNVQHHIDVVVKYIKSGQIKNYDWYPAAIKKRFFEASGGIIDAKIPNEFQEALETGILPSRLVAAEVKTEPLVKTQEAIQAEIFNRQNQIDYESNEVFSKPVFETQNENLKIINNVLKNIKSKNIKKAPDPISLMTPKEAKKAVNAMNAAKAKEAKAKAANKK